MELGLVGLGRMGSNMAQRLLAGDHAVVAHDVRGEAVEALVQLGARGSGSLADLVRQLRAPRAVWVMVPAGEITETTIDNLADLLSPGDVIIDGGNSYY